MVDAIDLDGNVSLGQGWDASDGYPNDDNLDAHVFLTPCGVLVTVLWVAASDRTNDEDEQVSQKARMMGYDIATGTKLWSQSLQEITGLPIPEIRFWPPTFTPDCQMVFTASENSWRFSWDEKPPNKNVVIDVHTGEWVRLDMGDLAVCTAAGTGWAGCWGTQWNQTLANSGIQPVENLGVQAVDLSAPGDPPLWADVNLYSWFTDPVTAGRVWSSDGYRDPATGAVVFGADAAIPEGASPSPISYLEPIHVSGWRSGIVVRVDMDGDKFHDATCSFSVWDPEADQTTWAHDGTISCGTAEEMQWVVAGQSLVVTFHPFDKGPEATVTQAYSVADGRLLWTRTGDLQHTGWESMLGVTNFSADGVSENYVFFERASQQEETSAVVRISDGAEFRLPKNTWVYPGDEMIYQFQGVIPSGEPWQLDLIAYRAQPSQSESSLTEAWRLALGNDGTDSMGIFATGGRMYVITRGEARGDVTVTPLVNG